MLFGLSLPLSKSFNSILTGLVYIYYLTAVSFDRTLWRRVTAGIRQPLNVSIVLYVAVALLGLFMSEDLIEGVRRFKTISNLLLVYVMVSTFLDLDQDAASRRRKGEQLLLSLVAGLFVFDLIGLSTYFGVTGDEPYKLPLAPLNTHHIWFANLNAVGLYTAVSLLLFSSSRRSTALKVFLSAFVVIGVVSILLSTSRTAWFGLAVVIPVYAFFLFRRKRHFLLTLLLLTGTAILLYLFNSTVHTRILQIFSDISRFHADPSASSSVGGRFMMWKASWKMFLSNPLFGVGTGDYILTVSRYVDSGEFPAYLLEFNQPHNIFIFALATNGLLGLAAVLYLFCCIIRQTKGLLGADGRERLFGFVALPVAVHFMVAGLTDSLLHIQVLLCTFAFVLGVCVRRSVTGKGTSQK
ncbi:MAG: O-antigen ligase family protein [Nitrospirae bacterium]|nr:O-antigen ligase family protein [Nitrospirota bacterium]